MEHFFKQVNWRIKEIEELKEEKDILLYLDNVLDMKVEISIFNKNITKCHLVNGFGGPYIYIDVLESKVIGFSKYDKIELTYDNKEFNDFVIEYFQDWI